MNCALASSRSSGVQPSRSTISPRSWASPLDCCRSSSAISSNSWFGLSLIALLGMPSFSIGSDDVTWRPGVGRPNAGDGSRTHTEFHLHWILSPARLPVPPLRRSGNAFLPAPGPPSIATRDVARPCAPNAGTSARPVRARRHGLVSRGGDPGRLTSGLAAGRRPREDPTCRTYAIQTERDTRRPLVRFKPQLDRLRRSSPDMICCAGLPRQRSSSSQIAQCSPAIGRLDKLADHAGCPW